MTAADELLVAAQRAVSAYLDAHSLHTTAEDRRAEKVAMVDLASAVCKSASDLPEVVQDEVYRIAREAGA